ncbi:MAG TPA: right-handed parallel beta-helix repeat-containing protein [Polyangiaceae bacterium]|nr:right-handed parallel beta-helix repeat-containing protein [Polyangiaceae bacterium]
MSNTLLTVAALTFFSAFFSACSDTGTGGTGNANGSAGGAMGGANGAGTGSELAGSSSVSGNANSAGSSHAGSGGTIGTVAGNGGDAALGGNAGGSNAGSAGTAGSVAGGSGGDAGQAGTSGNAGSGGSSSTVCTQIEGTARPAFTAPVSGCGAEQPGIRASLADRVAARSVCPAAPVIEAAIPANCPDANPNDNVPDDDALQACLNRGGLTALAAGSPGFILAKGLKIFNNGQTLRGADPAHPARLVAAATLQDTMVRGDTISDTVVRFLELDGNRDARTALLGQCGGYRIWATGLAIRYSRNFVVADNHITNTLCGSALEVDGSDFEVARNVIEGSGHGLEAKDASEPWADGITLHNCFGGEVHDNKVIDATDVGIVSGGGACNIVHNDVSNVSRHVFGGITLHDFTLKGVDHSGTVVAHNIVTGKNGMISFGFSLGIHPWHNWPLDGMPAPYNTGGTVACNQVAGSNFNLEVDGVKGLTVVDNVIGEVGGSPRCKGPSVGYTTYGPHVIDSQLQAGATEREFDGCIP